MYTPTRDHSGHICPVLKAPMGHIFPFRYAHCGEIIKGVLGQHHVLTSFHGSNASGDDKDG